MASRWDRSQHGSGVIIMVQENILFDKIDTTAISLPEVSEIVAISHREFLIVCCYRQPSASDLTLFSQLDKLLVSNTSLSPVIRDFNVHEASWLKSSHTSTAGTAALDSYESRELHQLIHFPTQPDAMLDLLLSEHTGTVTRLPNLYNSDHVAIFISLATSYHSVLMPPPSHMFTGHMPHGKNFHDIFVPLNGIFMDLLIISPPALLILFIQPL